MLLDAELLKKTGVFGLVSGELIAFIGGGYLAGKWLDNYWKIPPIFTVGLSTIGLSYSVWRIHRLSKKWMETKNR